MDGKCTIYFEDPFWVGVFERTDEAGYSAARVVFGPEPGEAELWEFARSRFAQLVYSVPGPAPEHTLVEAGYKRRQREAARTISQHGAGTASQRAIMAELERNIVERQETGKAERQAEEERQFLLRQERRREKHRGH